jgi:hypothetical protein
MASGLSKIGHLRTGLTLSLLVDAAFAQEQHRPAGSAQAAPSTSRPFRHAHGKIHHVALVAPRVLRFGTWIVAASDSPATLIVIKRMSDGKACS